MSNRANGATLSDDESCSRSKAAALSSSSPSDDATSHSSFSAESLARSSSSHHEQHEHKSFRPRPIPTSAPIPVFWYDSTCYHHPADKQAQLSCNACSQDSPPPASHLLANDIATPPRFYLKHAGLDHPAPLSSPPPTQPTDPRDTWFLRKDDAHVPTPGVRTRPPSPPSSRAPPASAAPKGPPRQPTRGRPRHADTARFLRAICQDLGLPFCQDSTGVYIPRVQSAHPPSWQQPAPTPAVASAGSATASAPLFPASSASPAAGLSSSSQSPPINQSSSISQASYSATAVPSACSATNVSRSLFLPAGSLQPDQRTLLPSGSAAPPVHSTGSPSEQHWAGFSRPDDHYIEYQAVHEECYDADSDDEELVRAVTGMFSSGHTEQRLLNEAVVEKLILGFEKHAHAQPPGAAHGQQGILKGLEWSRRWKNRRPEDYLAAAAKAEADESTAAAGDDGTSSTAPQLGAVPEADDIACCVCNELRDFAYNQIVFCDGCDIAVHQWCYGIEFIPPDDEPWLCDACSEPKRVTSRCSLCGERGGAMKKVERASLSSSSSSSAATADRWVHTVCAFFAPGLSLGSVRRMGPVVGLGVVVEQPTHRCELCSRRGLLTVACSNSSCTKRFHISCARDRGLYIEIIWPVSFFSPPPPSSPAFERADVPLRLTREPTSTSLAARCYCYRHSISQYLGDRSRLPFYSKRKNASAFEIVISSKRLKHWGVSQKAPLFSLLYHLPIFVVELVYNFWLLKRSVHGAPLVRWHSPGAPPLLHTDTGSVDAGSKRTKSKNCKAETSKSLPPMPERDRKGRFLSKSSSSKKKKSGSKKLCQVASSSEDSLAAAEVVDARDDDNGVEEPAAAVSFLEQQRAISLREDLEKIRLLVDLCWKRERLKLADVRMHRTVFETAAATLGPETRRITRSLTSSHRSY